MTWAENLTIDYLKGLINLDDDCQDLFLEQFKNYFLEQIETLTGLDFNFDGTVKTQILKNDNPFRFGLSRSIAQIGAWQTVTKVEMASLAPVPVWQELIVDQDIQLEKHQAKPYPIVRLVSTCHCTPFDCYAILRITGIPGFGPAGTIPPSISYLLLNALRFAYRLADDNGQTIASESSVRLSQTYKPTDTIGVFTDIYSQPFFKQFIDTYQVYRAYPY